MQVQRGYVQLLASKEQRWEAAIQLLQTASAHWPVQLQGSDYK